MSMSMSKVLEGLWTFWAFTVTQKVFAGKKSAMTYWYVVCFYSWLADMVMFSVYQNQQTPSCVVSCVSILTH